MATKKIILLFSSLCLALVMVLLSATIAFGVNGECEKTLTVYASKQEQEAVLDILPHVERECVVPGSVTPFYYYILYDKETAKGYKCGDAIVLSPVTTDGQHLYAVSLRNLQYMGRSQPFYSAVLVVELKNGKAIRQGMEGIDTINEEYPDEFMSLNYADFAEDIRIKSGRSEIIDPRFVRLVNVSYVGTCFYVKDDYDEFFYLIMNTIGDVNVTNGKRIIRVGEELERAVDMIKEFIEKERFVYSNDGDGGISSEMTETVATEFHPATGDYSNIELYFGVNIDDFKTHFPDAFVKPVIWPYYLSGGIFLFTAAAVVVVLTVIKKKKKENMAPSEIAETREKKV